MSKELLEARDKLDEFIGETINLFGKKVKVKFIEVDQRQDGNFEVEINGKTKLVIKNINEFITRLEI